MEYLLPEPSSGCDVERAYSQVEWAEPADPVDGRQPVPRDGPRHALHAGTN